MDLDLLPVEASVDTMLRNGTPYDWWRMIRTRDYIALWDRARAGGAEQTVVDGALAELPSLTALQSMRVKDLLANHLAGTRWIDMRDAREEGLSWTEIGDAIGQTRQAVRQSYERAIERQERDVREAHDTHRARAALQE